MPFFSGYLVACAHHPDEILLPVRAQTVAKSGEHLLHSFDPIEVVLSLSPDHVPNARIAWPATLEGFSHIQTEYSGTANADLAAALLLAAGANPWIDARAHDRSGRLPFSIERMVALRLPGLFSQALSHPSAWPVEQLTASPLYVDPSYDRAQNFLEYVFLEGGCSPMLEALFAHGLSFSRQTRRASELLAIASCSAVQACAKFDVLSILSPAQSSEVQAAWIRRVKSSDLSPDDLAFMVQLLRPTQSTTKISALVDTAETDALLSVSWGEGKMTFPRGLGISGLTRSSYSKSQLRGKWTTMAGVAMAALKASSGSGTPLLPFEQLLAASSDTSSSVNLSDPGWAGALSSAISPEWRPGISLAAPLALSTLSASREGAALETYLAVVSKLFGISDLAAWVGSQAPAMVAFTSQVMKPRATAQHVVMLRAWHRTLSASSPSRRSSLINALDTKQRYELLFSLTGSFFLSRPWAAVPSSGHLRMYSDVFAFLGPSAECGLKSKDTYEELACFVRDLACSTPEQSVHVIKSMEGHLDNREVAKVLKAWISSRRDDREFDASVSCARSYLLAQHTVPTHPRNPIEAPRM